MAVGGFPAGGFAEAIEGRRVPSDYYDNPNVWSNWFDAGIGFSEWVPDLGTVTLVEVEGDLDRLGRRAMIFKVVDCDDESRVQYFSKTGHYDAFWREYEWDGEITEVVPQEAKVTAWVNKPSPS